MKSRFKGSVIIMKRSYGLMFRLGSKEYDYDCIRSLLQVNDPSFITQVNDHLRKVYDHSLKTYDFSFESTL